MERGRPRATDFTLRVGCGFPRTPPALSEPPSPRVSEPPPRSLPAIHSTVPFLRAGPGLPSGSPDAPTPGGRGPRTAGPGASGRRGEQAARRAPQPRCLRAARKPEDPLFSRPTPVPPGSKLPASPAPTPLPTELLKFETCSPSPRTGSARGSRDSPPGCGRRCPVPGGSRLRERRRRTRRAGGRSGNWAAARNGLRLWAQRSGAVPTRARARCARAPRAAAGRAADPPGSAELGAGGGPRAPTSSRPGARVRTGRRGRREQEGEGRRDRQWGRS